MIPQCFYSKPILKLIDACVLEGYQSFTKCDEVDQDMIVGACLKLLGNEAFNCIAEISNPNQIIKLFTNYLLSGSSMDSYDLLQTMRSSVISYYQNELNDLFVERMDDLDAYKKRSHGLKPVQDRINGEITWI